jgi:hypothetical protein
MKQGTGVISDINLQKIQTISRNITGNNEITAKLCDTAILKSSKLACCYRMDG